MTGEGWICCQLGAREHYAIPRALHAHGALTKLITEFWFPPGSEFLRILPASRMQDLRGRYHPDLPNADIKSLNRSALKFELLSRLRRRSGWTQIMARNHWFQRKVAAYLSNYRFSVIGSQCVVFAYSYAARDIFRVAKKRGWKTVLGQIDPGPVEEQIVAEEVAREPELAAYWQPAPLEYWNLWREECELADRIVVNSEWSRACLVKAGVNSSKLFVIPLAYEPPITDTPITREYPARFTKNRPLRVLFLGQVNLRKGVARLLKAIHLLEHKPIEFYFVGPVQISIPHNLRNDPRIQWLGSVSRNEVNKFYRNGDLLVFPTLSDGFGLTQLEAQAWSLPIIASRFCGEVVRDGVNGVVLGELTADVIADALRLHMGDPARLGALARNTITNGRFRIEALAGNLLRLFDLAA
jgi:glycosyltransferase involved in cell wall biosynthesis